MFMMHSHNLRWYYPLCTLVYLFNQNQGVNFTYNPFRNNKQPPTLTEYDDCQAVGWESRRLRERIRPSTQVRRYGGGGNMIIQLSSLLFLDAPYLMVIILL